MVHMRTTLARLRLESMQRRQWMQGQHSVYRLRSDSSSSHTTMDLAPLSMVWMLAEQSSMVLRTA